MLSFECLAGGGFSVLSFEEVEILGLPIGDVGVGEFCRGGGEIARAIEPDGEVISFGDIGSDGLGALSSVEIDGFEGASLRPKASSKEDFVAEPLVGPVDLVGDGKVSSNGVALVASDEAAAPLGLVSKGAKIESKSVLSV